MSAHGAPSGGPRISRRIFGLGLLFVLGLGVQSMRVFSAWHESRGLEGEIGQLAETMTAEGARAQARGGALPPLEADVPTGRLPGPVLLAAVELLNQAEIYDYRYRFLSAPDTARVPDGSESSGSDGGYAIPPAELAGGDDGSGFEPEPDIELSNATGEDWPLPTLPTEAIPAPPEWKEWALELEFAAAYPRALHFLHLLRSDDRLWTVPTLQATRESGMVTVDLVLKTYTRVDAVGATSSRAGADLDDVAAFDAPERDPFRSHYLSRRVAAPSAGGGVARSRGRVPALGGILSGAGSRAWLDGRAVGVGERVDRWTVVEIRAGEVVLRHDGGSTVRLAGRAGAKER
ncbi:MAG: hypothetical protein IT349_14785 [Candidatus Eisenbacteria bacterium]|nr:hypothetical protein [Candidatus Eisenbacteria bacterium]